MASPAQMGLRVTMSKMMPTIIAAHMIYITIQRTILNMKQFPVAQHISHSTNSPSATTPMMTAAITKKGLTGGDEHAAIIPKMEASTPRTIAAISRTQQPGFIPRSGVSTHTPLALGVMPGGQVDTHTPLASRVMPGGHGQIGTEKLIAGGCRHVGLMLGPFALTVTAYPPDAPRLSTPVEPVLVSVHAPSAVPPVVLDTVVVFVNEVLPGVVTVQSKDVAIGGETLVLRTTAGGAPGAVPGPGTHPVTTAFGIPTVGHSGQLGVMIVDSVSVPHAGSPGTDIVTFTVSCVMKPGG